MVCAQHMYIVARPCLHSLSLIKSMRGIPKAVFNFCLLLRSGMERARGEFNNVITPTLSQVGQEIGQSLSLAGGDILQGLEAAGNYLENNPQLIVQIFLTIAVVSN
jgi:hypothetical protein